MPAMQVAWTPEMSIDGGQIDIEHQSIIQLINSLGDSIEAGSPIPAYELLSSIHRHVFTHFAHEEELMISAEVPLVMYQEHVTEHNRFRAQIIKFTLDNTTGTINYGELLSFLIDWFTHHTSVIDVKYKPYLDKK